MSTAVQPRHTDPMADGREQQQATLARGRDSRLADQAEASAEAATLARAVLVAICEETGVSEVQIYAQNRRSDWVAARQAAMLALSICGVGVTDIGRQLQRDHSTTLYGIKRAKTVEGQVELATRVALAACAVSAAGVRVRHIEIPVRLAHVLAPQPTPARTAVRAYIVGALLRRERYDPITGYRGLCLLARDTDLRQQVASLLNDSGLAGHVWQMREHARQARLKWIA